VPCPSFSKEIDVKPNLRRRCGEKFWRGINRISRSPPSSNTRPNAIATVELAHRYTQRPQAPIRRSTVIDEPVLHSILRLHPTAQDHRHQRIRSRVAKIAAIRQNVVSKDDVIVLKEIPLFFGGKKGLVETCVFGHDKGNRALSSRSTGPLPVLREPEKTHGNYLFAGPTVWVRPSGNSWPDTLGVNCLRL